jgi:hypothetical protein
MSLERRKNEKHIQHRGLLLYAMQHPDKRSVRCVARAIGRPESTLRGWIKTRDWFDRSSAANAENDAVSIYRRLYLKKYGHIELPEVKINVVVPLSTVQKGDPPESPATAAVRAADAKVEHEILRRETNERQLRDNHIQLIDGALGYVVGEMKAGRIRATLRDIPTLFEARRILIDDGTAESGVIAQESVRVRTTREAGGDVLEAVWEDIEELRVIIGALRTREAEKIETATPSLVALDGGNEAS